MTSPTNPERAVEVVQALERQCANMAFILNHVSVPGQWYAKFKRELEVDRDGIAAIVPEGGEG
jgi:hypothetical protein